MAERGLEGITDGNIEGQVSSMDPGIAGQPVGTLYGIGASQRYPQVEPEYHKTENSADTGSRTYSNFPVAAVEFKTGPFPVIHGG